ncbi:MAG: right-handed parallel beta-helix repeat-containing protein [Acidobacteriota bacterium]
MPLTEDTGRPGQYYRENVPDGEYKVYVDLDKSGSPVEDDLYKTPGGNPYLVWHGENKVSKIAENYDENGKHLPPFWNPRNSFIIPAFYNMVSFDPSTFTFTWTNDIYIVNGRGGYGTLKAGSVQLEANAMTAFINMSDTGTGNVGVVTIQKAAFSVSTEIGNEGNYFLAARVGDVVSGPLWDLVGISTEKILDGAVTTDKIPDGAITESKIPSTNRLSKTINESKFFKSVNVPRPAELETLSPLIPYTISNRWAYSYEDAYINEKRKLKRFCVYAVKDGQIRIHFIQVSGTSATWVNTCNELYKVKAGWNYIDADDIDIPIFEGEAYIAVGSKAEGDGVLAYKNSGGNGCIEFDGSTNTATFDVPYQHSFYIETYEFDLYDEILAGNIIQLPAGACVIDGPAITLRNNQAIIGKGIGKSVIFHKGTETEGIKLLSTTNNILSGFTIDAKQTFSKASSYFNSFSDIKNQTGIPAGGKTGISIGALSFSVVENIEIKNCGLYGLQINNQANRTDHVIYSNIIARNCFYGIRVNQGGEYCALNGINSSNNVMGIAVFSGNVFVTGSHFNDNRNNLYLGKAANDSHGSFTGCTFNHAQGYAIIADEISNGETFAGCHAFEGEIYLYRSKGFTYVGGIIDAQINVQGGTSHLISNTAFQKAYWAGVVGHNYNSETSYLKMKNNYFMLETGDNDGLINN